MLAACVSNHVGKEKKNVCFPAVLVPTKSCVTIIILLIRLNPFQQYCNAYLNICLHVHMLAHEECTSRHVLVGNFFCFCNKIMGVRFLN